MNRKNILTTFFFFFLFSTIFDALATSTYTVGVKMGDWAKYSVTVSWFSTDPAETEPPEIGESKKIEWLNVEVKSISVANTTILMTYHFQNGTDQTQPLMSADIRTQFLTYIIPSNLGVGDVIPGTGMPINGTTIRNYANTNRNVNYISFSGSLPFMNITQTMYWDKATGTLCEMQGDMLTQTDSYVTSISVLIEMTETNLWPDKTPFWMQWWFWTVIAAAIIATMVVYFIKVRKQPSAL